MRKRDLDADMPVGKLSMVRDALPSPEELMLHEKTVKVTLRLSEKSVRFFKQYAQMYHTKYQKVIRRLVDVYAERFTVSR